MMERNFKTVLCEIRKDEYKTFNSDVEVFLMEHIYSYDFHDYIATISLSDDILDYLGKNGLSLEILDSLYKENEVFKIRIPAHILFNESERVIRHNEEEYTERCV